MVKILKILPAKVKQNTSVRIYIGITFFCGKDNFMECFGK